MQIIDIYKPLNWWEKINVFSLAMIIVGLILVPVLKLPFIILFFISSFGAGKLSNLNNFHKRAEFWLLIAFYVWHIAGLLLFGKSTKNVYDVEVKLPFILMPIGFLLSGSLIVRMREYLLRVLFFSLLIFFVFSVFRSSYLNIKHFQSLIHGGGVFQKNYFFYVLYVFGNHPSYLALFLGFSWLWFVKFFFDKSQLSMFLYSIPFAALLYFAASRMGIYGFFLTLYFALFIFYIVKRNLKRTIVYVIVVSLLFAFFYKVNPRQVWFKQNIEQQKGASGKQELIQLTEDEMNNVNPRTKLWKGGLELAEENWMLGVGTGQMSKALNKKLIELNTPVCYQKHNVHNQYLETWAKTGLPGIGMLLAMFVVGFWKSWKRKDFLLAAFLILSGFHFLAESMLEKASGVTFFVLFYCLLMLKEKVIENQSSKA